MAERTAAIAAATFAFDNSHGNSRPLPPPNALEEPSHNENFQAEVLNDKKKKNLVVLGCCRKGEGRLLVLN